MTAPAGLVERLRAGHRPALARALTMAETGGADGAALARAIAGDLGRALVLGITGPPGAGKSTLVDALIGALRRRDKTIGVVAVDPSSPISGGAILGDRVRMTGHGADDQVFVRSLASRGHLGGLSAAAVRVIDVFDAAGKDVVLVETVGAGQSEVEIAEVADTKVVVCAPGLGDDVQAIKAGILEIADILVVNKADTPLAERTAGQLASMLALRQEAAWTPPVLLTTATTGEGVEALVDAVFAHAGQIDTPRAMRALGRTRRLLAEAAGRLVSRAILEGEDPHDLVAAVQRGEVDPDTAAARLAALYAEKLSR